MEEIFKKYLTNFIINNNNYELYYNRGKFINNYPVYHIDYNYRRMAKIFFSKSNNCWMFHFSNKLKKIFLLDSNIKNYYPLDIINQLYKTKILNELFIKFDNKIKFQLDFFNYKNKNIINDNIIYVILGFKKYEISKEIYELILSFIRIIEINNKLIK